MLNTIVWHKSCSIQPLHCMCRAQYNNSIAQVNQHVNNMDLVLILTITVSIMIILIITILLHDRSVRSLLTLLLVDDVAGVVTRYGSSSRLLSDE